MLSGTSFQRSGIKSFIAQARSSLLGQRMSRVPSLTPLLCEQPGLISMTSCFRVGEAAVSMSGHRCSVRAVGDQMAVTIERKRAIGSTQHSRSAVVRCQPSASAKKVPRLWWGCMLVRSSAPAW
jgi:hypothetical protein